MNTRLLKPTPKGIAKAGELLSDGHLVAIPTETVYGLAADATNGAAVASIFTAKERPMDNPLIVHIADIKDWDPLVTHIPPEAKKLADAYWPGPLTMILPASDKVPTEVTGGLTTVAVRFPSHPVAQAVILHAGCPLAAPSANRSGSPSPTNASRVKEDMDGRIAAIVDGGDCAVGVESTVLDLCHNPARLLRPGGITPDMIEEIIGPIEIDSAVLHTLEEGAIAASPGMKYKHYAPKAEITIVKGGVQAFRKYVNDHAAPGVAALCFEEDSHGLNVPTITYGSREDAMEQARLLFDALRKLDEIGATTVYAACPSPCGVGLAVYNRLLRAAAFRTVNAIRVIGLTGPTGSGKSTAASVWKLRGAAIIDTDQLARKVVEPGSSCLSALVEQFSDAILLPDGQLNRTELAKRAFATPENTNKLNSITHPCILALAKQQMERAAERGHSVAVVDAPLLFESGFDSLCEEIVTVIATPLKRRKRICKRDNLTEEQAQARINAQQPDSFYCRNGVTVLTNNRPEWHLKAAADDYWMNLERRWWT